MIEMVLVAEDYITQVTEWNSREEKKLPIY